MSGTQRGFIKNRNEIELFDYRDANTFLHLYPKIKLFGLSSIEYFYFKQMDIKHTKTKDQMVVLKLDDNFFQLNGKRYSAIRYRRNYYKKRMEIDIREEYTSKQEVIDLIRKWKDIRQDAHFQMFIGQDINYFEKYFDKENKNIISRFFYHGDEIVGYVIVEKIQEGVYQHLLRKVNTNYAGLCLFVDYSIFELIYKQTNKPFIMNFGSCSGSKGILQYKTLYFPVLKIIPYFTLKILTKTSNKQKEENTKQLGKFYSTNADQLIGNQIHFLPNKDIEIIDPFCGDWDLLNFMGSKGFKNLTGYDIDSKYPRSIKRDTLLDAPDYKGQWIVTNPPYQINRKHKDKTVFKKFKTDDLYKAAILSIMSCEGGIMVLPLNFICGSRSEIRKKFFYKYEIIKAIIFEEPIFENTSVPICTIVFKKKKELACEEEIVLPIEFYPDVVKQDFRILFKYDYRIGTDFFDKFKKYTKIKISMLYSGQSQNSNLHIRLNDKNTSDEAISLTYDPNKLFSDRYYDVNTLRFPKIDGFDKDSELFIAKKFNEIITHLRKEYRGLILHAYNLKMGGQTKLKHIPHNMAYMIIYY